MKLHLFAVVILMATQVRARQQNHRRNSIADSEWQGKWFPGKTIAPHMQETVCDDGVSSIGIDFDPARKQHNYNFICTGNRQLFEPHMQTEAQLVEQFQPVAYEPSVRCMNETLLYEAEIPTFGSFRPVAAVYGTYKYMPPQRWLRSLAEGAIVMLYHPCAFPGQVVELKNLLEGCLYRHIITPSPWLSAERPLALIAWGKSLQMSVVDKHIVVDFIKQNAKMGPLAKEKRILDATKAYKVALEKEAHLVTDEHDTEICGFAEM